MSIEKMRYISSNLLLQLLLLLTLSAGTPFYPWNTYSRDGEFNRGLFASWGIV